MCHCGCPGRRSHTVRYLISQFGMMARDSKVGKDEVIVGGPADSQPAHRQRQHRGRAAVDAQPVVLRFGGAACGNPRSGTAPAPVVAAAPAVALGAALADQAVVTWPFRGDRARGRDRADRPPGHLGRRVNRLVSRLAPDHRALLGVTQADHAATGGREPAHPPGVDKRAVRTAEVLHDPRVLLVPQDGTPHDTRASVMTMSDLGSRPSRYEVPGCNLWSDCRVRTTSTGPTPAGSERSDDMSTESRAGIDKQE